MQWTSSFFHKLATPMLNLLKKKFFWWRHYLTHIEKFSLFLMLGSKWSAWKTVHFGINIKNSENLRYTRVPADLVFDREKGVKIF